MIKYIFKNKESIIHQGLQTATIKSFELSYETLWKYLKFYLEDSLGIGEVPSSPRGVFELSRQQKIITDEQAERLSNATDGRNTAAHIYSQDTIEELLEDIPEYIKLFKKVLDQVAP